MTDKQNENIPARSLLRPPSKIAHPPSQQPSQATTASTLKRKNPPDNNNSAPTRNIRQKTTEATTAKSTAKASTANSQPRSTRAAANRNATSTTTASKPAVTRAKTPAASSIKSTASSRAKANAQAESNNTDSSSATSAASDAKAQSAFPKLKKRPAWDTKGRLQDMEEFAGYLKNQFESAQGNMDEMNSKLSESNSKIYELEEFRRSLEDRVQIKEQENGMMSMELQNIKNDLENAKKRHDDEIQLLNSKHSIETQQLQIDVENLTRQNEKLNSDLIAANQDNAQLKNTISVQSASVVQLEAQFRALQLKIETTESLLRERDATIASQKTKIESQEATITFLESKAREDEMLRRKLHNTIQELKGNIRVFCRVRPLLGKEKDESNMEHIKFSDGEESQGIELAQTFESADGTRSVSKSYPFQFDRVFKPDATQSCVFEEISQLVQSALDGYNEGPTNGLSDDHEMGMIPRSVRQIYESIHKLKEKGWEYKMEGQFLEIYNETIRDLLGDGTEKKHEIRHDARSGKTTVTDMSVVELENPEQVISLLKTATKNRAVGATNCNERSSRSHSVFIIRLIGNNTLTSTTCEGRINLIDLAGSERLSSSGSTGERLKETQAINKSLSCLGDVIHALGEGAGNGQGHVPYRNSKLTYLLQYSLGGNSKTLMFVNVSPVAANFNETLNSLRFATKVNSCQIGTAKRNVK
ncbi:P-loop containing nucleoside triphosphate hydrolase protein [Paraphysoderma sedebokerense]|nr:P-loop containing nucleoside triphosphate hydrolase protein [Paraphysoderma sedebokerense]